MNYLQKAVCLVLSRRVVALLLLCFVPIFSRIALADQTHIIWFSTLHADTSEKSGFWGRVHDLTVAAAKDLNLKFEVYYAEENYVRLKQQVSKVLQNPELRPDGIIFHNYKLTGEQILKQAEAFGVKSIIFNAGLQEEKGYQPRIEYKHWVGEILPDDGFAGAELLRYLTRKAHTLKTNRSTEGVVAMAGNPSSAAYQARARGLLAEIEKHPELEFRQFVPADWSRDTAKKQIPVINKRYPDNRIYWAANDNMALGLLDGAKAMGLTPGRDFVTGGIDWLPEALEQVASGRMETSVGGHFVEGMWALILLYDYLNGYDFADEHGARLSTKMLALTKENLAVFGDIGFTFSEDELDKVDFSRLSKTDNPELEAYPLNIGALLSFMKER